MKKRWSEILLLILCVVATEAVGARARAMGGAFIGLANDENAIFANPAGLSQLTRSHYHVNMLLNDRNDYKNDSFAFASQIWEGKPPKKFSIEEYLQNEFQFNKITEKTSRYNYAISYVRDYKSIDFVKRILQDHHSANALGSRVANQIDTETFNLAFATKFPMAPNLFQKNEVYGGINFQIQQVERTVPTLNRSSSKEVFNIGLSTLIKTPHNFSVGATLDAIVSERVRGTTGATGSSANLSLGGAYQLDKTSVITMDLTNILNAGRAPDGQYRVGFERELIKDELSMRLGSWDGTFTMGFGLKLYEQMKIDYGYFNGDVLKEHYISTSLPF